MKNYSILLDDEKLAPKIAMLLLSRGYYPVPCGAGEDGKGWLVASGNQVSITKPGKASEPPPHGAVIAIFDEHPGAGISVAVPYLRDSTDVLIAIDVDVYDPITLEKVALVIGSPCPVKVGMRGATFFTRSKKVMAVDALLDSREIPIPKIPDKNGKPKRSVQSGKIGAERWDHEYIDVLGTANRHSVLPPSLHIKASQESKDGSPVYYRWVPFPGSTITKRLEDTDPSDLPLLEAYHLLLLFQWAKNPESPIWHYLGETSKGNHHQLMLDASLYLWHEKFKQDEIVAICEAEAYRSAEDDHHYRERCTAIRNAVQQLAAKFPEQKPSRVKSTVSNKGDKMPLDRLAADWLRQKIPVEDTGSFNGFPYRWNEGRWQPMVSLRERNPIQMVRAMIQEQFDQVGRATTTAAAEDFLDGVPARDPQPNTRAVAFANGMLDVLTEELRSEAREDYVLARLTFDYDPNAECPIYDQFISDLMRPPPQYEGAEYEDDHRLSIEAVEEFLGYSLVLSHEFRYMLFLIGATSTGKSELIKLIRNVVPQGWVSDVPMSMLGEGNALMNMVNAHLNVSGEVGRHGKDVDETLLKVTTGERVTLKILYKDMFEGVVAARLMFHGNLPPDTTDSTGAIAKRMILLRTTDKAPDKPVNEFHKLMIPEAQGIMNRWVRAYARLLKRGHFEHPSYAKDETKRTTEEANSVSAWVSAMTEPVTNMNEGSHSSDLFMAYREWCEAGKMYCFSIIQWGKLLTGMGFPSKAKRIAGGRVVNFRALKLINEMGARF